MSVTTTPQTLPVWKCYSCGRVLMEIDLREGTVRKICERCKAVNTLVVVTSPPRKPN